MAPWKTTYQSASTLKITSGGLKYVILQINSDNRYQRSLKANELKRGNGWYDRRSLTWLKRYPNKIAFLTGLYVTLPSGFVVEGIEHSASNRDASFKDEYSYQEL